MSKIKVKIPTLLKAEFREKARAIVQKDRDLRKSGCTTNTAGEIAQALEQAYRAGHQAALQDDPVQEGESERTLSWIEIPPRPRNTLESICAYTWVKPRSMTEYVTPDTAFVWCVPLRKWIRADIPLASHEKGISDQSIQVLIRLGLLLTVEKDGKNFAFISPNGWESWQKYLLDNPTYYTWLDKDS